MTAKPTDNDLGKFGILEESIRSRQSAETFMESDDRYQFLLRNTSDYIALYSLTGTLLFASDAIYHMIGYKPEEVTGTNGFNRVHPEDRRRIQSELNEAIESGRDHKVEFRAICKDGGYKWVEMSAKVVHNDQTGQGEVVVVVRDVSERKRIEEALQKTEEEKTAILDAMSEAISYLSVDLKIIWSNSSMYRQFNLSPDQARGRYCYEIMHKLKKPCKICPVVMSIETGKPHVIDDFLSYGKRWTLRAYPVRNKAKEIIGYVSIVTDITERKWAEEELQKVSKLQSVIFNNSTVGIGLVKNRVFEMVNRQMTELFGIPEQQFLGASTRIIFPAGEAYEKMGAEAYTLLAQGKKANLEYEMRRGDGSLFWCRIEGNALDYAKPQDGSIWIWEDITERKQAEEFLRESEERYRLLFSEAIEGIFKINLEGRPLMINPAMARMFGYDSPQVLLEKATIQGSDFQADPEQRQLLRDRLLREETVTGADLLFRRFDGSPLKAILNVRLVRDKNGTPAFIEGSCMDITDKWIAEEELKASEEKYRKIFEGATEGIYQTTPGGRYLSVNPAFAKMFGYASAQEMIDSVTDIGRQQYVNPQEREEMARLLRENDKVEGYEAEIRHKDGSRLWVSNNIHTVRNVAGDILYFEGISQDITERKKAEEGLLASTKRYRMLYQSMIDAFVVMDMDGLIQEYNDSYKAMLGYTDAELRQMKYSDITPAKWHEFENKILNEQIMPFGCSSLYEKEYRCKDGTVIPVELRVFIVWDDEGNINGMSAIVRDITKRKQAQEALKKAHDELERRVMERTAELAKAGASMKVALDERKRALKLLKKREADLSVESQRLQEMNAALNVLLRKQAEDKQELEMKVLTNIRKIVLPYVEKLQLTNLTPVQNEFTNIIISNLENVISPFLNNLTTAHMDLTPREIEVANLTREGKTAKECAALLNLSIRSIETYKDNIRKKLKLNSKKTNLRSYLMSLS